MIAPSVSVVVVSRGRPEALTHCLTGLGQLIHPNFEIVVVADTDGLAATLAAGWGDRIKMVSCDIPNISIARNLGIGQAAGEVVAFIDDDAVPEPTWLAALTAPFAKPEVVAAGGFVRGRNGISFQWRAREAFADGTAAELKVDQDQVLLRRGVRGRAIKTEGTNMAFRRQALADLGGFDPAYSFYLDETDVNMRLAAKGCLTAIVPMAQVHHGFAPSRRRRGDRVPLDLFEIGASIAAFVLRHGAGLNHDAIRQSERDRQRKRLLGHMVAGRIGPEDVGRILATFDAGWRDGQTRKPTVLRRLGHPAALFQKFTPTADKGHVIHGCRPWRRRSAHRKALAAVADGYHVSLFVFSPTIRRHSIRFTAQGYWLQRGGLFGVSTRDQRVMRAWKFSSRLQVEAENTKNFREISQIYSK